MVPIHGNGRGVVCFSIFCTVECIDHHKTLQTNFCLVRLSNGRTQIYRLVVELPSWNGAVICYGPAVCQLLGGSRTIKSGAFPRRAKKAEAQQLALKNIRQPQPRSA